MTVMNEWFRSFRESSSKILTKVDLIQIWAWQILIEGSLHCYKMDETYKGNKYYSKFWTVYTETVDAKG